MNARVNVIVLNWNGKADTLECLASLRSQTIPIDIVVVDNGSHDDSVATIRRDHPGVTVVETGNNLGYTGGNNVGIRHALASGATHIFILNNDTLLAPDCVAALLADCEAHPSNAACAPKSLFLSQPETIYFAGGRITNFGSAMHVGLGQPDGPDYSQPGDTDWITGCALFGPRKAFEQVGLFDERFFLLFEDVDWSLRARSAGMGLRYVPTARLWHSGSKSFGGKSGATYQYYFTRNGLLWLERYFSLPWRLLLGLIFLRESWARAYRLGQTWQERAVLRRATLQGIKDYLRRRFGRGNVPAAGEAEAIE